MTQDLDGFAGEVRAWIAANFPAELAGTENPLSQPDRPPPTAAQEAWRIAVGRAGWGTPTWPMAYGGGGLTKAQAKVLEKEMSRAGAYNPMWGMGVSLIGPTLLEFGSEAQKQEHIPPIVRGELHWCQGFSEPGAGSDLASLSTRAVDMGDHFVINGSKIWTSGAQYADWIFCLVRTDTTKKHAGISFVLFSMHQPGVEVKPIRLISGHSTFCETFFTDAIALKKDLVGPLNGGWSIAKRLLQFERDGMGSAHGKPPENELTLHELAARYVGVDGAGHIADADLRARLLAHEMESRVFSQTVARVQVESRANAGPSTTSSILKNVATRLTQERTELTLEILGNRGLGWEGAGFSEDELHTVRKWLSAKAYTIYGGSHEVQNNIVAKRILGLPDPVLQSAS